MKPLRSALPHSLRGRLLVGTLTWILVSMLMAGWALSDLFRQHIARQLTLELTVHMNQLVAALTVDEQGTPSLAFDLSDPRLEQPYSGLYWQIDRLSNDGSSESVFHSRSLWDQTLKLPADAFEAAYGNIVSLAGPEGSTMLALQRVVTPPEGAATYRLVVAVDNSSVERPLGEFRVLMAIFLGLLALGLTVAAVVQVVVGLRPLALLRERLADVRTGRAARIEGRFPSEIQPLVQEFNAVLHSNEEIVERARTQAGNLAHALKTPLSVLANGAVQEDTPFGWLVTEQVELAGRQVEHHLARARAAAAVRAPGKRTEVASVVQGLARMLTRLYAEKGVQLDTKAVVSDVFFRGEQQDLQEMLGNLMENACKWADRNVLITIGTDARDGLSGSDSLVQAGASATLARRDVAMSLDTQGVILFRIDDDGPGLSTEQRDAIFQRGVRMDERKHGSGLGLAIVRDLATAYGGSVCADASPLGGLGIELRLPGEIEAN
ncbi:MAG: sensor histidine kinase [Burkholderiaceae bacterium]